jgi:hypothetical protein
MNEIVLPDPRKHDVCYIMPSCVYDVSVQTHYDTGHDVNITYKVPGNILSGVSLLFLASKGLSVEKTGYIVAPTFNRRKKVL